MLQQNREDIAQILVHLLNSLLEVFVLLYIELGDCVFNVRLIFDQGIPLHQQLLVLALCALEHRVHIHIDALFQLVSLIPHHSQRLVHLARIHLVKLSLSLQKLLLQVREFFTHQLHAFGSFEHILIITLKILITLLRFEHCFILKLLDVFQLCLEPTDLLALLPHVYFFILL